MPSNPSLLGACNAIGPGIGGVAFIPTEKKTIVPILWRKVFQVSVQARLVSLSNYNGIINNSDLELCRNITHHSVVAQFLDILERIIVTLLDNIVSVFWLGKRSTTTTRPPVYLL